MTRIILLCLFILLVTHKETAASDGYKTYIPIVIENTRPPTVWDCIDAYPFTVIYECP